MPSNLTPPLFRLYAGGTKVIKASGKPFKSGEKVNTIKGLKQSLHPSPRPGYTFEEDDSIVECFRCIAFDDAMPNNLKTAAKRFIKNERKDLNSFKNGV